MSIRPFRDIKRRKTKKIKVGNIEVGGDSPISVQSMTNTLTTDVDGTIKQINELSEAGADIVRVSCPDQDSSLSLKKILKYINVPIVADIHFHYKRAIEAAVSGAQCLRINPGNIGSPEKVKEVIKAAKDYNCSMRIGVNAGSLEKKILEKYKSPNPDALVESALNNIKMLEDGDFYNFKVSVKSSDVFEPIGINNINIDMVIQNTSLDGKNANITFTIKQEDLSKTLSIIEKNKEKLNYNRITHDDKLAKVSIIGAGMISESGVTHKMFRSLANEKINILAISTSEIKISVLIREELTQKAVKTLHETFGLN